MRKRDKKKSKIAWLGSLFDIKTLLVAGLLLCASFLVGVLIFNYIALPLWVGRFEEIAVPDVCGKSLEETTKILSEQGLKVKVEAQKFSDVPEGIVISQHPLPARRVKRGRSISLCVSRGREKVRVPWVKGLKLSQAEDLIERSGLTVGEIIYEYSEDLPNDEVVQTKPESDVLVLRGTEITVYVSQGLTEFRIPDFTWKTLRDVQYEASRLGLILEPEYAAMERSPLGLILAQSPLPGTLAKSGERLKVIVGAPR